MSPAPDPSPLEPGVASGGEEEESEEPASVTVTVAVMDGWMVQ